MSNQGTANFVPGTHSASVPSPEYSDSLDSTIAYNEYKNNFRDSISVLLYDSPYCSQENSPCKRLSLKKTIQSTNPYVSGSELVHRLKNTLVINSQETKEKKRK